jgi:hypothetical protein
LGAAEAEHRLSVQHMTRCGEMKMMVGRLAAIALQSSV